MLLHVHVHVISASATCIYHVFCVECECVECECVKWEFVCYESAKSHKLLVLFFVVKLIYLSTLLVCSSTGPLTISVMWCLLYKYCWVGESKSAI